MEEFVKDAVLTNAFTDLVLFRLVELTISAQRADRPLFPSLIQEPVFFRKYFSRWVREAMEEKRVLDSQIAQTPFADDPF